MTPPHIDLAPSDLERGSVVPTLCSSQRTSLDNPSARHVALLVAAFHGLLSKNRLFAALTFC